MDSDHAQLLFRLKIVRALSVGAFGVLRNEDPGLKSVWATEHLNKLQGLLHKLKTRGDSVRVIFQTVEDGAVAGPAVVALARSVLDYAILIRATISELVDESRIDEFRETCEPLIRQFDATLANSVITDEKAVSSAASRLPHLLKNAVPVDIGMYYCALAACNFSEGIDIESHGFTRIVRELKFPPEYQQAGLSILNYFSVILEDKYPDIPVAVSIQQSRDRVTLFVTLPDGSQDIIEKVLSEYGLVVSGQITPQAFLPNQMRALALQQKLELAQMEVRQTRDLLRIQEQYSSARIESLERDVKNVYELLGRELSSRTELQQGLLRLSSQGNNDQMNLQISKLFERLIGAIEQRNDQDARVLLEDISQADPDMFSKLSIYLYEAAATGAIGNFAFDWIKVIIAAIPK